MTIHRSTYGSPSLTLIGCCLGFAVLAAGCGGGGSGGRRGADNRPAFMPGQSKPPPGFPAQRDVPLDPALVSAARQALQDLLKSDLPSDRAHAIEGLRDTLPAEATGPVLAGLDDSNQIVRFAAAFAAGELKLVAARPKLQSMANDPDPKVRVAVRFALHVLGDSSRTADLEAYATDFGPEGKKVRGATAMVLGRLREPTAANVLRLLRVDPDDAVRQQAEESLFLLNDERAPKAIVGYISGSKFPDDQMFGLMVLAEARRPQYRNHAREQLSFDDPDARASGRLTGGYLEVALVAARALGAMGADDGYGVAMRGAKGGTPLHRALAAAAFGEIGRTDAQPYLAKLLEDATRQQDVKPSKDGGESDVRAAAATAILRIARHPKRYSPAGDLVSGG